MVSHERWAEFQKTKGEIEEAIALLKSVGLSPQVSERSLHVGVPRDSTGGRNGVHMASRYRKTAWYEGMKFDYFHLHPLILRLTVHTRCSGTQVSLQPN